jgi:thioredoxin reductase
VVGGGDSAVESALLLAEQNNVILSYRNEAFNRIKPMNSEALKIAQSNNKLNVRLSSNVISIDDDCVVLSTGKDGKDGNEITVKNDLVYIFAGGELPIQFLEKTGIKIEKKFGETVMKH